MGNISAPAAPSLPGVYQFVPAIFGVLVAISASIFFIVGGRSKAVSIKFFIVYSLIAILVFGIMALQVGFFNFNKPMTIYIADEVIFVIIGGIHAYFLRKLIGLEENESFTTEFVFTIYLACLAAALLTIGFVFLNHRLHTGYSLIFASTVLAFLLPFLFYHSFIYMVWIPAPVYKKWYYPVGRETNIDDKEFDDEKLIVLRYKIQKKATDESDILETRLKTPMRVEFSEFFAYIIDVFNDDPGKKIEFADEFSQPYGWNFYIEPKWYNSPRYIDPALSIVENGVREGDVIIAERIID